MMIVIAAQAAIHPAHPSIPQNPNADKKPTPVRGGHRGEALQLVASRKAGIWEPLVVIGRQTLNSDNFLAATLDKR